jgi:hypothetical protein
VRYVAPIVGWAVASIALGVVVGLSAVILPPMGAFGIVAVAGVVLLWVMPDLPLVSPGLIRKVFLATLIVDLVIPFYYTVQFSGLPWISARRLVTFTLIVPFLVAVAASSDVRRQIGVRIRASLLIFICAIGFLVMAVLSIFTSIGPSESLSGLVDTILSMYVPFFAMLYIVRDDNDVVFILKVICGCALFMTAAGMLEFYLQHNYFIQIFPASMLDELIANNPTMQALLPGPSHYRHGLYRANSTFVTPLSFGEFEIIVIPIGLFFAFHRSSLSNRAFGWAVVLAGIIGIFCSGSRGAWVGVIASAPVFIGLWSIRKAMNSKDSLAPAIAGAAGLILVGCIVAVINFSHSAHDMVLGGAAEAGSTQARFDQWATAAQYIKANPITGHGFDAGGSLVGGQIDSYILSLVLEVGIPGLVFFMGLLLLPIWYGLRNYLSDMSESAALAGALACSFIAFTENRLVLSQRENHTLIFSLLAIVIVANYERARKRVPQQIQDKSLRKSYYRGGRISPADG